MAFICQECKKPQAPGTKPVRAVTHTREVVYNVFKRVAGEEKLQRGVATGHETVQEVIICPTCHGVDQKRPGEVILPRAFAIVHSRDEHRGSCKKDLAECKRCQKLIEEARGLPLFLLSKSLEQPVAPKGRIPFGEVALWNAMGQTMSTSKRGAANYNVAVTHLAQYAKKHGLLKEGLEAGKAATA